MLLLVLVLVGRRRERKFDRVINDRPDAFAVVKAQQDPTVHEAATMAMTEKREIFMDVSAVQCNQ